MIIASAPVVGLPGLPICIHSAYRITVEIALPELSSRLRTAGPEPLAFRQ